MADTGETFTGSIDPSGNYKVTAEFSRAFKDNLVLAIKKEGYVSVLRSLPSVVNSYEIHSTLAQAEKATCSEGACGVVSNTIFIENVPGNVSTVHMRSFNPAKESQYFPGDYVESNGKRLVSSAFSEINLYDKDGNRISRPPLTYNR